MSAVIATDRLTKRYGDVVAVDGLSLRVEQGEIYGFLGVNGAGKSTTIRMLLGMVQPSGGSVQLFGTHVRPGAGRVWSHVGYLMEAPTAYPELTVTENLELARRLRGIPDRRSVARVMERLALAPYANHTARSLSSGNLQRLGLTKALLHEPDLLILDEPANGLDPAGVVQVRELLRALAFEQGVTVFMSSHILGEVARLATRLGIIHRGRLLEQLSAAELKRRQRRRLIVDTRDRPSTRRVLTGAGLTFAQQDHDGALELTDQRAVEHPDEIARLLVEAGNPPITLRVEQEDLETHFLRLITAQQDGRR
ncbi:MAG TPA: ABC transporter ATP-binding protein [Actinomycetes bacterium]|jgi:ABC-2 type transport system ATP-binding protein|nr:ABC transporter ATP-binding protein [Actinomycetes bacterium]